ncbi:hypothetical protein M758_6G202200 [Ceratodon purpureus]|nr:hypothetical protein M758_6G202200 [Ceratodon purpureus]
MRFSNVKIQQLFICITGVDKSSKQQAVDCGNSTAIHESASRSSRQFQLREQARTLQNVMLMQESVLHAEEEGDYWTGFRNQRPGSPLGYALAVDCTAAKMIESLIERCKLFHSASLMHREECTELVATLESLHEVLQAIQGSTCLNRYMEVLLEIQLYSSKAYAYVEKLCFKKMDTTLRLPAQCKVQAKLNDFANRFFNQRAKLCEEYERSTNNLQFLSPTKKRLSFGVTTYLVPVYNIAKGLYKKKHVIIPLTELEGNSGYNVELSYPRTWWSKRVAVSSKIESCDRGYSQILQAERVKHKKGSWGWDEAQHTVQITYQNLVVANVASRSGTLLTYNCKHAEDHKKFFVKTQLYRTSIHIVGWSRIDPDLQRLSITGMKDENSVYYKCFVKGNGKEVLAIYRYHREQFGKSDGLLHIVGRGNQPGLRHLLVSILSTLGFSSAM